MADSNAIRMERRECLYRQPRFSCACWFHDESSILVHLMLRAALVAAFSLGSVVIAVELTVYAGATAFTMADRPDDTLAPPQRSSMAV